MVVFGYRCRGGINGQLKTPRLLVYDEGSGEKWRRYSVIDNLSATEIRIFRRQKYETDCANTEGIFRIIQSIPSHKAEPFKRWLAKVGYERVQEIEDPELATKRTRMLYKLKGYPDSLIEKRMRGIVIREELTDEWQNRGAQEQKDFEILTTEISKAAFDVIPSQYKKLKGLKRENLRDHMDDLELIFTMLGERSTTEIHRTENSRGVPKLKADAKAGDSIASCISSRACVRR